MNKDLNYYERRSADERAAAEAAADSRAKAAHLELARRYQERCATLESNKPAAASEVLRTG